VLWPAELAAARSDRAAAALAAYGVG
jgi:hypothetical protein